MWHLPCSNIFCFSWALPWPRGSSSRNHVGIFLSSKLPACCELRAQTAAMLVRLSSPKITICGQLRSSRYPSARYRWWDQLVILLASFYLISFSALEVATSPLLSWHATRGYMLSINFILRAIPAFARNIFPAQQHPPWLLATLSLSRHGCNLWAWACGHGSDKILASRWNDNCGELQRQIWPCTMRWIKPHGASRAQLHLSWASLAALRSNSELGVKLRLSYELELRFGSQSSIARWARPSIWAVVKPGFAIELEECGEA